LTNPESAISVGPGIVVPELLVNRFRRFHGGKRANDWLAALPSRIDEWCARWEIELEHRIPPLTYNLVLFGASRRAGEVVLKMSPPWFEALAELEALEQAAGDGMVRLIDADPDFSLMMLERVRPGVELKDAGLSDEECTKIAASVMLRFWRRPARATNLITLESWSRALLDYSPSRRPALPEIPANLVHTAQELGRDLLATQSEPMLLHGDVHHQNILSSEGNGWTTIDPKGLVGDRGFEVGTWMRNPWGATKDELLTLSDRRLDQLADLLDYDRRRLADWTVFFSVLSLCWTLEDDAPEDISDDISFIRRMMQLLD